MTDKTSHITYRRNDDGVLEETVASIRRRIATVHGFKPGGITLLEGDAKSTEIVGETHLYYTSMTFEVCGVYFCTDFKTLTMLDQEIWAR